MLKISSITAGISGIEVKFDSCPDGRVFIAEFSPALGCADLVRVRTADVKDSAALLDYADADRDEITLRFFASDTEDFGGITPENINSLTPVCGKQYVGHIDGSREDYDYPTADTKKGLQVVMVKDAVELGVKHAALNVNLGNFMMPAPDGDDTIEFPFEGRVFYIRRSVAEKNDEKVKELTDAGLIITFILLNSRNWGFKLDEDFWNTVKHPDYADEGTISAFDVIREEGCAYYRAFVAFLTERYTRPDKKYGAAVGLIVGNEVNSGYVWCNAGEKTVERYTFEYTTAVRLAWQVALKYYKNMRIYVSLDHFWTGSNFDGAPLRYYGSKAILENLNENCLAEGQVGWNIAHHPYPEDLNYPDFWNDKTATDSPDTYRITFKNLEVLAQFTYEDKFLFDGQRRRIILSEQGFNSHWTPESEVVQAMAYGRAYKKVMSIPEIDSFILHAHCDNKFEFGLNLGLWRRNKDGHGMEAPKPIYYVFKAIDKKDEKGIYHWERY